MAGRGNTEPTRVFSSWEVDFYFRWLLPASASGAALFLLPPPSADPPPPSAVGPRERPQLLRPPKARPCLESP
eukprot:4471451-Pyramimonas_sp.AAC.1